MRPKAPKKLARAAEIALDRAKKMGATACAATAERQVLRRVLCRDGRWEELTGATRRRLTVRLFVDGRYAVHSTSEFEPARLEGFLRQAFGLTRQLAADPHRRLPGPALYSGRRKEDLELFDPAHRSLTLDLRKQMARKAHDAARESAGPRLISASAGFTDRLSTSVLMHSDGFSDHEAKTTFSLFATASLADREGKRPSDWEVSVSRRLSAIANPEEVGKKASKRARGWLGAAKIQSEKLPLVVENRAAGRIVRWLMGPLTGRALYQKRSCFETDRGKKIAFSGFDLVDDPLRKGGLGSRRYDGEGITAARLPIIEGGVLRNFYIDTYYGNKLGRKATTGSRSNVTITPGTQGVEALLQSTGRGLFVTRFIGGNSNSVTGDFSVGLNGFLLVNGKVARPVAEMNIAGNHKTFWNKLTSVGSDPYANSSLRTPSLVFAPVMTAGK